MRSPRGNEKAWIYGFVILAVILFVLAAYGCIFNPTLPT